MKLAHIFESSAVDVPIYRGLKVSDDVEKGDIIPLSARMDRKPKDTSIMASMIFNYGIQCRFGVPDVRKSSIFAASNFTIAKTYAKRPGYAVVQLQLPVDALIIYNRRVSDSMTPMERKDVKDFTLYMGKYIDDPTMDQYLNTNSGELFQQLVSEAIEDGEEFVDVMRMFEDLALSVTEGYDVVRADEMEFGHGTSIEFMIQGVRNYSARVMEVKKVPDLVPATPQVDDDNIPF